MTLSSIDGTKLWTVKELRNSLPKEVQPSIEALKKIIMSSATYRQIGDHIFLTSRDVASFMKAVRKDGPKSHLAGSKRILDLEPDEDEYGKLAFLLDRSSDTHQIGVFWAPYDDSGVADVVRVAMYGNPFMDMLHERAATYTEAQAFWTKWSMVQAHKTDKYPRRFFYKTEEILQEVQNIRDFDHRVEQEFSDDNDEPSQFEMEARQD